jgi:hypothetical protein
MFELNLTHYFHSVTPCDPYLINSGFEVCIELENNNNHVTIKDAVLFASISTKIRFFLQKEVLLSKFCLTLFCASTNCWSSLNSYWKSGRLEKKLYYSGIFELITKVETALQLGFEHSSLRVRIRPSVKTTTFNLAACSLT